MTISLMIDWLNVLELESCFIELQRTNVFQIQIYLRLYFILSGRNCFLYRIMITYKDDVGSSYDSFLLFLF